MFTAPLLLLSMSLRGAIFVDPGTVYLKVSFGILCICSQTWIDPICIRLLGWNISTVLDQRRWI